MKNVSIINELFSKCINQESDLNNLINEIYKGTHNKVLERIKDKVNEKLVNFDNSISLLNINIFNSVLLLIYELVKI